MTSTRLTQEQIGALDFQTEQLYKSFTRAVVSRSLQDAVWSRELFTAFGRSLEYATNFSAFMDWHRNSQRTPVFDKYLLHYAIGSVSAIDLERNLQTSRPEAINTDVVAVDDLKRAIDGKEPYRRIQTMAMSLSAEGDYDGILDVLQYVRKKFQ